VQFVLNMRVTDLEFSERNGSDLAAETNTALPRAGWTLVTSALLVICIFLMCFLETPWLTIATLIPSYILFWVNVMSAKKANINKSARFLERPAPNAKSTGSRAHAHPAGIVVIT
jgi:hypothetical protein